MKALKISLILIITTFTVGEIGYYNTKKMFKECVELNDNMYTNNITDDTELKQCQEKLAGYRRLCGFWRTGSLNNFMATTQYTGL